MVKPPDRTFSTYPSQAGNLLPHRRAETELHRLEPGGVVGGRPDPQAGAFGIDGHPKLLISARGQVRI